jgi:serum/glucocorticoid-regulated kinase 2
MLAFFRRQARPSTGKPGSVKSPGRGSGKFDTPSGPAPGSGGGGGGSRKMPVVQAVDISDGLTVETPAADVTIPADLPKVGLDDFDLLKVLGKGGFGKVMLVRKKGTTDVYAMKVLKKEAVIRRNQVQHTKTETTILKQIRHPFLTRMYFAFQSEGKLDMVLNYLPGGELFYRLKREGRFSPERVRLYTAEIALGLGHLHSLDMIYRDLKPENLLLDEIGHVCLTDFGLSKESVTTANAARTFCGTPEYLAPEILQGIGHGKAVDWWSLGTLVFEMLTGLPPFYSRNVNHMYEKILKAELRCPQYLHDDVKQLIQALLIRNPLSRLGSGPTDVKELERAKFFEQLDFEKVYRKEYTPIYKPNLQSGTDTANFDPQFTTEVPCDSVVDSSALAGKKNEFVGFSYADPGALG